MSVITVLRPDVEAVPASDLQLVERPPRRSGLRLTIIDNGKPRARELMSSIANELGEHLAGLTIEWHRKTSASWPITPEVAEQLAGRSDIVLAGLGDCGGCSASSLADAVAIERAGRPATVVITEPFQGLAASYARRLSATGYPCVVLPHPISSRSKEDLEVVAHKAVPTVLSLLTTGL